MKPTPLFLSMACVAALSGCVVAPVAPYPAYGGGVEPVWIDTAPAPYYEVVPVSPFIGGVWIGGSWVQDRGRREWRPGRWAPPHPGWHGGPRYRDSDRDGRPGAQGPRGPRGPGATPPHRGDGRRGAPGEARTPPPPRADSPDRSDGRHSEERRMRAPDSRTRQP